MLQVRNATVRFGATVALAGADLDVADGSVVALLGPSGCGKTTLLRVVAGLQPADAGTVTWDGVPLDGVAPHRRGFGLMFQDYALFPHRTVAGNVGFGLEMANEPPAAVERRVTEILDMVGLAGYRDRQIGTLSGGEQQRVALARALAPSPRLLMLDEPIGALDRTLRERLMGELRDLFSALGITALYVTHDQEEAFTVADGVAVMRAGEVVQAGPAEEVWRRPHDAFIAGFLGMNVVTASVENGVARTAWGDVPAPPGAAGRVGLAIRADAVGLSVDGSGGGVPATVAGTAFRSGVYRVEVALGDGTTMHALDTRRHRPGATVWLSFSPDGVTLLSP